MLSQIIVAFCFPFKIFQVLAGTLYLYGLNPLWIGYSFFDPMKKILNTYYRIWAPIMMFLIFNFGIIYLCFAMGIYNLLEEHMRAAKSF